MTITEFCKWQVVSKLDKGTAVGLNLVTLDCVSDADDHDARYSKTGKHLLVGTDYKLSPTW